MGHSASRIVPSVAGLLALGLFASAASAQQRQIVQAPLNNFIEVLTVDRQLLAFDAFGNKNFRARLELDEEVIWSDAQGLVGLVVTTRRVLAATPQASDWVEIRWRKSEAPVEGGLLSDRLALLATHARVLAFDSAAGVWFEGSIGPGERIKTLRAGQNNGIVVTNRRALGIAPGSGGFYDTRLRLHEDIERVNSDANLATIMTSERILVFSGGGGSWSELARRIHR